MIKNALIAIYILAALAISVVARAGVFTNHALENETYATDAEGYNFKNYIGEVVVLQNGSFALVTEDSRLMNLKSELDLTPFVGLNVMISGIELEHQLAPHYELESVDPLPGFASGNKAVVFFVFGISEVIE